MNLKKNLILGAITAGAASLGATATAIIMTRECHKMMESNKIENEEIKKELEENKKEMEQIKLNVERATKAFDTYKEKIQFADNEAKKMHTAMLEGFKSLANQGRTYQEDLKNVSKTSIDLMKKELKQVLMQAQAEVKEVAKEITEELTGELAKEIASNKQEIISKDTDDITEKMINQIDQDTGKITIKKKGKK